MSFFSWLKKVLAPRVQRDVSRLSGGGGADLDGIVEQVDLSGGPLKDKHRRRTLHDPRLLPKKKPPGVFPPSRRRRIMEADEAHRLFSSTMRTRDRRLRTQLPDVQQLERYDLPVWRTEGDVADALGVSLKILRSFSIHREMERVPHYVTFSRPKRNGGQRLIMAPKRRLRAVLRLLHRLLVSRLPVSEHAHGFRRGRSVRTGAEPHVGHEILLHMDLRDFFPSVHVGRVRGMLVAYGYGYVVATALAVLMTEAERQPVDVEGTIFHVPVGDRHCVQGAPTSPGLCNSLLLTLDRRLAGLARARGFSYTRYADDLSFSGNEVSAVHRLRAAATRIIEDEGFAVNTSKTRVMRQCTSMRVTGVVVNQVLGLSRTERRRLRAAVHQARQGAGSEAPGAASPPAPDRPASLSTDAAHQLSGKEPGSLAPDSSPRKDLFGRLAYLHMLNPAQAHGLFPEFAPHAPPVAKPVT